MAKKTSKKIRITLKRSTIKRVQKQKDTAVALGLRKLNQTVERSDTPVIRGMVNRISHLVKVEEI
ncbi:MAG: 50S ribosomal protein L30 [candidate division KSB1 bacterium]|nr:50S ribosomal protein L30 [candidate division KSB1 bacterium]